MSGVLISLLGFGLVACADGGNGTAGGPGVDALVAVNEESLLPEGSPLTAAVSVQPGSWLVGRVFPWATFDAVPGPSGSDDAVLGWQAVLVVDGDPIEVWNSYARAFDVGDAAPAAQSCIVEAVTVSPTTAEPGTTPRARRFLTERRIEGENLLDCTAAVGDLWMSMRVGLDRSCEGFGDPRKCTLRPIAHLFVRGGVTQLGGLGADELRYERGMGAFNPDPAARMAPVPGGPVVRPDLPEPGSMPALPGPGDAIDDGIDYYLGSGADAAFRVPVGGRSLIAPAMLITWCNSGLVAVLRVQGSPDEAVGFLFDTGDSDYTNETRNGMTDDGARWTTGGVGQSGGYDLGFTAVARGDDHTDLLLSECGD